MEEAEFGQIARIKAQCHCLSDIRRENCRDVAQTLEVNAVDAHLACPGDVQEQQIQLLQRVRHAWQEAVRLPPSGRRYFSSGAFTALVHVQKKGAQPGVEVGQGQRGLPAHTAAGRRVAVEFTEEHLVDRRKESLNAAATSRLSRQGKDQPNFQIRADLLQMTRGEIAAVIGVEHLRDAAHIPARIFFTPDRLPERQ